MAKYANNGVTSQLYDIN